MRRTLATLLSLALTLGSRPAGAVVRVALPVAPLRAAPVMAAAPLPSLSLALLPAAALNASLKPLTGPAPGLVAPGAFAAAAPAAAAPASAALARLAGPEGRREDDASPLPLLRAMGREDASPDVASLAFDAGVRRAAADAPGFRLEPPSDPGGPRLERPSPLRRPARRDGPPTAWRALSDGLGYGALLGSFGLASWGVIGWLHAPSLSLASSLAAMGAVVGLGLLREAVRGTVRLLGRPLPAPVAAPRAARLSAGAFGAALGLMLAAGVVRYEQPLVEGYHALKDLRVEASRRENVRAIGGPAFARETESALSRNAAGRAILDGLRDRSGTLRLPRFYVVSDPSVYGRYDPTTDGVYLDAGQILEMGYTVERFLADPAVQAEAAAKLQSTLAHELTHAGQARRSPLEKGFFLPAMEDEYEAFVNELWYNHERLKADPSADLQPEELDAYHQALTDLAGYLRALDGLGSYSENVHVDSARWRAWRAGLEARWPGVRAEGYRLLARRAKARGEARQAARYELLAREAAAAAGAAVPAPSDKR